MLLKIWGYAALGDANDDLAGGAVFKQIDLRLRQIFNAVNDMDFGLDLAAGQQLADFRPQSRGAAHPAHIG